MRYLIVILLITVASNVAAAPLESGLVDDDYPVLDYSSTWTDGAYVDAYGGGYQSTSDVSAEVSFETFATGITIYFLYDMLGDDVEVCVDSDCTTVSTVGMVSVGKIELTNLPSGLKTVTASKVTADTTVFNLDAVYIHPSSTSENQEVSQEIIQFDFDGQSYTGVLDLRLTSGEAAGLILLVIIATLLVFNLITGLVK